MEHDRLDDRVQERTVAETLLREPDHRVHPRRQRLRRRRDVQDLLAAGVDDLDAGVVGKLQAARGVRSAERVPRDGGVQRQHRGGGQRPVLHLADRLHRPVVVQDHPLAAGPRRPAGAEHAGGGGPGGGGALELARSDRLADQRVDDEPVAGLAVHHLVADPNPAVRAAVDPMQRLLRAVRQHEAERAPADVAQRQQARQADAGQFNAGPPLRAGQPGRRIAPAQRVPVEIAPADSRAHAVRHPAPAGGRCAVRAAS